MRFEVKRYICWGIALVLSLFCLLLHSCSNNTTDKETIVVYAPEKMQYAFLKTLNDTKMKKQYNIVFTENIEQANFRVTQGGMAKGELFAYTPIIAVLNNDESFYEDLKNQNIIVPSMLVQNENDLDFKQVMEKVIEESVITFKIACPSKNSAIWEEFYDFLLLTINDGIYPQNAEIMKNCKTKVNKFLESKYIMEVDYNNIERMKGIPKDIIYFMTEQELVNLAKMSDSHLGMRIVYPKNAIYHNYYVEYDKWGEVLFNYLSVDTVNYREVGYFYLYAKGFCNEYRKNTYSIEDKVDGQREKFDVVEIPIEKKEGVSNVDD